MSDAPVPRPLDELIESFDGLGSVTLSGPEEIEVGRDGILMRVGEDKGALYLPQVAPEQGWDLAETLLNLCVKAGLTEDCWTRDDARFHTFAGQWFGEED